MIDILLAVLVEEPSSLNRYVGMPTIISKYEHHVMIIIQILSMIDTPALAYAEERKSQLQNQ